MAHVGQARSEADNVAQLGNYAFVYAMLLSLGNFGFLCGISTLGVPVEGHFGAIDIARLLFRGMAVVTFLLGVYAYFCMAITPARRRLIATAQFLAIAAIFFALSINYGDVAPDLLSLLQWIGTDCTLCSPFLLPA